MDNRVGMWPRVGALLIDALMMYVIVAATQQMAVMASAYRVGPNFQAGKRWVGVWFLMLVAPPWGAVMYSACDVFFGATPGRALLRLRVADQSGRRASRRQLLTRWAMKYAPLIAIAAWIGYFAVHVALTNGRGMNGLVYAQRFILPPIGLLAGAVLLGGLLIFQNPRRQALHDRLARTAVFRKSDVTAASFEPVFAEKIEPAEHVTPRPL